MVSLARPQWVNHETWTGQGQAPNWRRADGDGDDDDDEDNDDDDDVWRRMSTICLCMRRGVFKSQSCNVNLPGRPWQWLRSDTVIIWEKIPTFALIFLQPLNITDQTFFNTISQNIATLWVLHNALCGSKRSCFVCWFRIYLWMSEILFTCGYFCWSPTLQKVDIFDMGYQLLSMSCCCCERMASVVMARHQALLLKHGQITF